MRCGEGEPAQAAVSPQMEMCIRARNNPGLVLYLVNRAVLGELHIIGVFIQQEALRRFGFPDEHAAVEDVGHLVNAGAGFLQLAQQLVTLVQLFVACLLYTSRCV